MDDLSDMGVRSCAYVSAYICVGSGSIIVVCRLGRSYRATLTAVAAVIDGKICSIASIFL